MKKVLGVFVCLFLMIAIGLSFGINVRADASLPASISTGWTTYNVYGPYWAVWNSDKKTCVGGEDISVFIPDIDGLYFKYGGTYSTFSWFDSGGNAVGDPVQFGSTGEMTPGWYSFTSPGVSAVQFRILLMTNASSTPTTILNGVNSGIYTQYTVNIATSFFNNVDGAILDSAYETGFDDGYALGKTDGDQAQYDKGYAAGVNQGLDGWELLWASVLAPFDILALEIIPGLYIGYFALIPIVFGLLAFLFRLKGKK